MPHPLTAWIALAASAGGVWLDVPFVRQQRDGCGAASLAMVLQYWKDRGATVAAGDADPQRIQQALYSKADGGIRAAAMTGYLLSRHFRAITFRGVWADLAAQLAKGRPLVVCLREGAALHYVVVAGLEPAPRMVLLNDPERRKLLKLDGATFESRWKDHWTLLAVPQSLE